MDTVRVFCPATIANISCGFDVLGLCLDAVGDEMIIKKVDRPGVVITKITGQDLPLETEKNVAGVAALAMLNALKSDAGFEIEIHKGIKAGSGIGSSAASAAGAVFGINKLLNEPFTKAELVAFAAEGEKIASGVAHADNVAPALLGGFTLVRSCDPLDVIAIPVPDELMAVVIHPQIEVRTEDSRAVLKENIPLKKAIVQWGNVGALVAALYSNDYELLSRSLHDEIVEPHRSILIPGFDKLKKAALKAGALGCGISGSGPSIFALTKGETNAKEVASAMKNAYADFDIQHDIHISKINTKGTVVI
ncbi:homoserine kinase [Spongiivirga citrea]|uniref:Homoserine kinase n=1 Tax=Spongiivirga citrea TaxID=1481457 RepID=A0A6M0CED3_9FLAO|nr:homoserine kinase [Spongiivirga citrea]NER16101.1 homoserine kinase [Spongiivirga citrea]